MSDHGGEVLVVPARPGPLRPLPGHRAPDEVDELLDDLFGPPDEGGPGPADAVLVGGGGAALVGGLAGGPVWLVGVGVVAVALGAILPARALWRGLSRRRLAARRSAVLGEGTPLRVTAGPVADLVDAHGALLALPDVGPEALGAAHAAIADVAEVLAGSAPTDAEEAAFVADRAAALRALVDRLAGSADEVRRARLAARQEVDRVGGTSSLDRLRALGDDA